MLTKEIIEKYFFAEKHASLILAIMGLMAVATAIVFVLHFKTQWYKGFAIPILIFGIIHFSVGYVVYKSCDDARKRMVYAYDMNTDEIKNKEIPRVDELKKNFERYTYFSSAILLIGLALYFYFRLHTTKVFWAGVGLALALEAIISLSFIFIGEKRTTEYSKEVESFIEKGK